MTRRRLILGFVGLSFLAALAALPIAGAKPTPLSVSISSGPSRPTTATTAQFALSIQGAPTSILCKQEDGVGDVFAGSGGLATAPAGGAWQTDRGALTAFTLVGGTSQVNVAANQVQLAFLPLSPDFDVSARLSVAAGAAANTKALLEGRVESGSRRYLAALVLTPKGALQLQVERSTTNATTVLGTPVTVVGKYQSASQYYVRFQGIGSALRAKAWANGALEPGWQIAVTDSGLSSGTGVGFGAAAAAGGATIQVDDFVAVNPALAGSFTSCASATAAYSGLVVGGHVFTARVATGNDTQLTIYPWTINPPAPTVTLSSQPPNPTMDTSATFAWATTGVVASTNCTLDGATAPCTSPKTYSGLSTGNHSFSVTVANVSGSDTKSFSWTVNPPAPTVAVSAQPSNPTTDTSASFAWTTTGVVDTTSCALDGVSASCASPRTYSGLTVGTHSFTVTVSNVSGSDSKSVSWTVNPPAPTVGLVPTAQPPAPNMTFSWVVSGQVDSTTCALDSSAPTACSSPKSYTGLPPGPHTFTVTVTNVSGSDSDSYIWTVPTPAPTVTLTTRPANPTADATASFAWTTTSTIESTACTLDGSTAACSSPRTYTGLAPGSHNFSVTVTNASGSDTESFAWDITPPTPLIPLAVSNNAITKVQVRYYDECRNQLIPNSTQNLAPLPDTQQAAFASQGGGILWGMPKVAGDLSVGDGNVGFGMHIPAFDVADCGGRVYLPVGVEVRIASRDEVDFNQSCAQLRASKFADCFRDISLIRVWPDGNPSAHPLFKDVTLTGGCAARADAYFGAYSGLQPVGGRTCNYGASVNVDFGNRYPGSTNFQVQVNGVDLQPPNGPGGNPTGTWTTSGSPLVATTAQQGSEPETGDNPVRVKVFWKPPSGPTQSYPAGNGAGEVVQQAYIGTQDTAGAIDLARTSGSGFSSGLPSAPLDNIIDGNVDMTVFPTIGIRSSLPAGVLTTLRFAAAQDGQTLQCDPDYSSGAEFSAFRYGCKPWYAANPFVSGPWWNTATKECPDPSLWFSATGGQAPYGTNSFTNPWRCVVTSPGMSSGAVSGAVAVRTGNCGVIGSNSCSQVVCNNASAYPNISSTDPRLVRVIVVPYGATKLPVGGGTMPVAGTAYFYITGWGGTATSRDQCPGSDTAAIGAVVGYFVQP